MSRVGSRKSFDLEWIEKWARRVNEDRILPVIGRFFNGRSCSASTRANI